jgi:HlyD family secretion protein
MKKVIWGIIFLLAAGALIAASTWFFSQSKIETVQVTELQLASLRGTISTNGKVEAAKIWEIRAPQDGFCREIFVKAGNVIKSGQPIFAVENPALDSDMASARAELEAAVAEQQTIMRGPSREELGAAEADIERLRMEVETATKLLEGNEWLLKRDAIARFDVEQSRRDAARVKQQLAAAVARKSDLQARFTETDRKRADARIAAAQARSKLLEAQKSRSIVRAPSAGTLYQFELNPGAHVSPGEVLGHFADLTRLQLRAFVDEPELGHVTRGAEVTIKWDARPEGTWSGTVAMIPSEMTTRGTRSVAEVLCSLTSPPNGLIPNVNVDIEITTSQERKVQTLPRQTVFKEGTDHFVWTVQAQAVAKRKVEVGRATSDLIEITGGIRSGEPVVIPGEAPIQERMKVRVAGK